MAPSPENDSPPKAPDKEEKRGPPDDRTQPADARCADDGSKQETDFFNLNEKDLKHLLDEAISYKSPKDREGKSELFNNLLTDAENELRNARATSASGPETVRHYNKRATKRHGKGRKASSISENLTHSGSLNNLTKEDLFEETIRQRPKKTVSARQTEGGSLPCNVNVGAFDQYLDDFRPIREMSEIKATIGVANEREMTAEAVRKKNEADVIESLNSLSLKGKKSQKVASVDDRIPVSVLDHVPSVDVVEYKKSTETTITNSFLPSNLTGGLAFAGRGHKDEKKVDENCNAVPQQTADGRKGKAKKRPMEKNVTVWESSKVTGHRSDIINDVDKLIDYIDGTDMRKDKSGKSNVPKKLQKHIFDDGKAGGKKQRTRAKAKNGGDLQKSNSLEEISTTKIEDFEFLPESDDVVLRQTKSNTDRPRERRSWGTSEPVQVQALYTNASAENLETADFRVVTKKKKSKKQRRNSLSSRKTYREEAAGEFNRVPSPEPRRKSAISVPHSERSNDSSDVDSVHSLPVDATNLSREMADDDGTFPISYADIAKNSNSGSVNSSNSGTSGSEKGGSVSSNGSGVANNRGEGRAVRKEKLKTGSIEKQGSVEVGVEAPKAEKDSSDKVKVKKEECKKPAAAAAKVEKEVPKAEEKAATNAINNSVNYSQNFPSIIPKDKNENKVRNPIAEIQTWPAIPNNNNNNKNNLKNSIANTQKKMQNHFKNTKNIIAAQQKPDKNNLHNSFASMQNSADATTTTLIYNNYNMPINIPDVRSIEKQFKNSAKLYNAETQSDNCETAKADAAVQMSEIKKPVAAQEDVVRNSAVQCEILQKDECCLNLNNAMSSEVTNNTGINLAVINSSLNRTINNAINNNNNLTHNNNNNKANAATVASPTCTLTSTSTTNTTTFNNNNNNSSNANYNAAVNVVNANSNSAAANPNLTTASSNRPAVVILSGGAEKEVSGITFGFDIEQLLSNDVCADFMTRFVPPRGDDDVGKCFNLDKIVSFIGIAWEDVIKESNGKVKYYTESL